jgi:hypothetical protein
MNIDYQLGRNTFEDDFNRRQVAVWQSKEEPVGVVSASHSNESFNNSLGLFSGIGSAFSTPMRKTAKRIADMLRKKKKTKRKRGMKL